ncbi:hypothetical protein QMG61_01070 [Cryobacterium sp. PH31-AA6]|uniref:hypothetical protein n=1 Tax=Cryobacterium sp. PH31-AA6 TaxID=3046205 RepID=UPI0024BB60BC|nr:hypothetical protein [Cryobacterium sp. PH31-AA6]MDJ0322356.1 hypothetical protein [Cryobacterium sp. PH31-AA6]
MAGYAGMLAFFVGLAGLLGLAPVVQNSFAWPAGPRCCGDWADEVLLSVLQGGRYAAAGVALVGLLLSGAFVVRRIMLRVRPRFWTMTLFWMVPAVLVFFFFSAIIPIVIAGRMPQEEDLGFVICMGSMSSAGLWLAFHANRTRSAPDVIWAAGTQVTREVQAVIIAFLVAVALLDKFSDDLTALMSDQIWSALNFFTIGVWFLVIGPGWTAIVTAETQLGKRRRGSRAALSSGHQGSTRRIPEVLTVLLFADVLVPWFFWPFFNVTNPEVVWFWLANLVAATLLLIARLHHLRDATDDEWPKCSEAARQLVVVHGFSVAYVALENIYPHYSNLFGYYAITVIGAVMAALWILILGPDLTVYRATVTQIRLRAWLASEGEGTSTAALSPWAYLKFAWKATVATRFETPIRASELDGERATAVADPGVK